MLLRVADMAASGGWAVTCLAPPGPFADEVRDRGVPVAAIPDLKLPDLRLPGAAALGFVVVAWNSARAARVLRREARHADVILLNGLFGLPALNLARPRIPSAWLVHDVIHRRSWRRVLRIVGPAADLAVAVSDAVAEPLRAEGLETVVVRNGTRWPVDPAAPFADHPPVVGCAALLTPWKGQDVLLDAMARVAEDHPKVELELLGGRFPKDAAFVEALEARSRDTGLAGRVRFLGHQPDPLDRMRRWTVAVLPSVDPEAGPLALLEYMSLGLPIVATDHGGTPEVLGDAGVLVPPRDANALAAALTSLLDDPARRARCSAAGRAAVDAGLSLEHQQRAVQRVLDELSRRPRRMRGRRTGCSTAGR